MKIDITWTSVKNFFWALALVSTLLGGVGTYAMAVVTEADAAVKIELQAEVAEVEKTVEAVQQVGAMTAAQLALLMIEIKLQLINARPEAQLSAYEVKEKSILMQHKEIFTQRVLDASAPKE